MSRPAPSHALVLLRHGESTANAADTFGGWLDCPLTPRGREEASAAALLIRNSGLTPASIHTSVLTRAVDTAAVVARTAAPPDVSVNRTWRLNERHYGRLEGRRRRAVREEFGDELFAQWRRSYDLTPPAIDADDPTHPRHDARYRGVDPADLPSAESLADVRHRLLPYWTETIAPDLRAGRTTLVVAHGNSLRALCMVLDCLTPEEVRSLHIPTGVPLRYDLDATMTPAVRGGRYLDPRRAAAGIAEVAAQGTR